MIELLDKVFNEWKVVIEFDEVWVSGVATELVLDGHLLAEYKVKVDKKREDEGDSVETSLGNHHVEIAFFWELFT